MVNKKIRQPQQQNVPRVNPQPGDLGLGPVLDQDPDNEFPAGDTWRRHNRPPAAVRRLRLERLVSPAAAAASAADVPAAVHPPAQLPEPRAAALQQRPRLGLQRQLRGPRHSHRQRHLELRLQQHPSRTQLRRARPTQRAHVHAAHPQ